MNFAEKFEERNQKSIKIITIKLIYRKRLGKRNKKSLICRLFIKLDKNKRMSYHVSDEIFQQKLFNPYEIFFRCICVIDVNEGSLKNHESSQHHYENSKNHPGY